MDMAGTVFGKFAKCISREGPIWGRRSLADALVRAGRQIATICKQFDGRRSGTAIFILNIKLWASGESVVAIFDTSGQSRDVPSRTNHNYVAAVGRNTPGH